MNVSGHRISTIEVESALVDHPEVAEAAVCGRSDPRTGQAIVAYVTLKGGAEGSVETLEELRDHVGKKIGPIAKPANIVFTPELPKTRSGKIMRRLLRDVAEQRRARRHDHARRPDRGRGAREARIVRALTVAERPDLAEPAWEAVKDQLPEYNNHGDVLNRYWGRLTEERPEFQFHLVDGDEILARARCVPVRWDGTVEDLPAGIDGAIARGFDEEGADVLCAMLIVVPAPPAGPRAERRGAARDGRDCAVERARGAHRTGAAELEGPLSARPDRALRGVAARGRAAVRPVAARARARRRERC